MERNTINNRLSWRVFWLAGPALAVAAPAVGAWEYVDLRASTSVRADSNVRRLPDGVTATAPDGSRARSDVISTYGVGASLDLPMSRQRLLLSYDITQSKHATFSNLDFDGEDGRAILYWEVGRLATGQAGVTRTRTQADLADTLGGASNLRTSTRKFIDARYPFHANWQLNGGISSTESVNSDTLNRVSDSTTDGVNLELRYVGGAANFLGVRAAYSEASFPNPTVIGGVPIDNGYKQQSYTLVAGYTTGGASSLQMSIGQSRRRSNDSFRGTSTGFTGSLAFNWSPTGATNLSLTAAREFSPAENVTTSGSLSETLEFSAGWKPTATLTVQARVGNKRRNYTLTSGLLAGVPVPRQDDTRTMGLSVSYAAHARLTLSISAQREQRDSSLPGLDYTADIVSAMAQLNF